MTRIRMNRRSFCAGFAAGLLPAAAARPALAAAPVPLTAQEATVQLAPEGYPATGVWSYDGTIPGPLIRAPQGGRLERRLVNRLPQATSVHWHGIRLENAMDGVAGLTQDAVPPGGTFDYAFGLPDAGTYWYHAHANSVEQVARGLSGPLIIDEPSPPDIDRDEVLMLDDWLLDPATGAFAAGFGSPMMRSHAGRIGNLTGVNGRYGFTLNVRQNERLRLRLINAASARIFTLRLEGMAGWTAALDGMPLEAPLPAGGDIILAPAQRADLIVDITAAEGEPAGLLMRMQDGAWQALVETVAAGRSARRRRQAPAALPPNPGMGLPDLAKASRLDMVMEGGAMAGLQSARYQGETLGFRALAGRGQFWALSGQAGMASELTCSPWSPRL